MTVYEKQVGIAVVVVVKKLKPPAAKKVSRWRDLARLVREDQLAVVVIKAEKLVIDVSDEQVLPAVGVVIGCIHAHSRSRPPGFTVSHTRGKPDLLKLPLAFIKKEKVGHRVVGNE